MVPRFSRALVALTAVASTLALTVAPAAAADPPIPNDPGIPVASGTLLPFTHSSPGDVVVDEAHGHVFVSGGKDENGVALTDLDGNLLQTLPDLAGADGMLLSGDGSTVYVALAAAHAVAALDTSTLAVTTYGTGDACPRALTQAGSVLYFTAGCGGSSGDVFFTLSRLDPSTGDVAGVTLNGSQGPLPTQGFYYGGPIASDPASPGRLFVVDQWDDATSVRAFDLDASGLDATLTDSTGFGHDAVNDLTFSLDHSRLLAATRSGVVALDPASLSQHAAFSGSGDLAVATGAGYVASAGSDQATVNRTDGSYGRTYYFDGPAFVGYDSVAWASDRLFVVAQDQSGSLRLFTLTDYATPAPSWYGTSTGGHVVDDPHQVKVWATLDGQPFAGRKVRAWRSGPDGLVDIGSDPDDVAVSDSDGLATINDAPPLKGLYRYTYLYDGEAGVAPQEWTFTLPVSGLYTTLTLDKPPTVTHEQPIHLQGTLVEHADGSPIADAPVALSESFGSSTRAYDPVRTGPDGTFSFDLPPGEVGNHVFSVGYAGDERHEASSASRLVTVQHTVTVGLTAPPAPLVSAQGMTFHGTVTDETGAPVGNEDVKWERWAGDPASVKSSGTVRTNTDGTFSFSDRSTGGGVLRWRAIAQGDTFHAMGSGEVSSTVYWRFPTLAVTTDRSTYDYGSDATLSASANDDAHGTVRLYTQPAGEARSLLAEGPTKTGTDLTTTVPATRNTALALAFEPDAGDYLYAPGQVGAALAVRPNLAQRLRGGYATSGRTSLVHRSRDPRLTLGVAPALPGRCTRVTVQRYRDGGYATVRHTGCIALDSSSRATWTLTGAPPAGARFRLRYDVPGDAAYYASARAPWAYVRFTR